MYTVYEIENTDGYYSKEFAVKKLEIDTASAPQTLEIFVADKLREAILQGNLKPGERLDENAIADLLNVSRTPVRAGLRIVASEGLIELYPHRGAIVAQLSPEEIEETYFIRGILEGIAARLGAANMDADHIATLRGILDQLNSATDPDEWLDLNGRLHNFIYQLASRPRLLSIIGRLRDTTRPYGYQYIGSVKHIERVRSDHERLFDACTARDGQLAQEVMQAHLMAVCEGVLASMEST